MAIIVSQVKVKLEQAAGREQLFAAAAKTARLRPQEIERAYLVKTSVDARKQDNILLVSSVGFELKDPQREGEVLARTRGSRAGEQVKVQHSPQMVFQKGDKKLPHPPVVVGFGPAGMFAGLSLAREGYCPIILERGADVDSRVEAVNRFWKEGRLNTATNVQFGEGGAGTFSDGKLTTRISDPRCSFILEEMIRHGAPEEIRYRQKPHVGTDLLRGIVKSIREEIIRLGGQVRFGVKMERLLLENGRLYGVKTSEGELPAEVLVLAIGHSARDTFEVLEAQQVFLEPKPFSVGVRIEQRQQVIDYGLYGAQAGHPLLPKGEYQLSWRDREGRGVYTFCMCPGGFVVASSSEENTVVTNGMSYYARDGVNANSALLVGIGPEDFGSEHPLAGMFLQREIERRAFVLGGRSGKAPCQTVGDLLSGRASGKLGVVEPSYKPGVVPCDLAELLPAPLIGAMREALPLLGCRLRGFDLPDAVLTGPETRSSSPVRISRDETFQSVSTLGLYPCGEGAGYAGGITSAAVDGVRCAEAILKAY